MMKVTTLFLLLSWMILLLLGQTPPEGLCPGEYYGTPPLGNATVPTLSEYNKALNELDIKAVLNDIGTMLTESQDCWPADIFPTSKIGQSYGGLFVRLSWHCSGSYRNTDGAGGCGGGRQRFWPENSWIDNANLDKARALLWPIKQKYGIGLSWGDLFIFAGTGAILKMGGPINEVCAGRIDDSDGTSSLPLGPGQGSVPCEPLQGDCQPPVGTSTVGLIYVNPEGYMGIPNATESSIHVRDIFNRMGFNDRQTVALIGGGHAFGKCHGACPDGPGPDPSVQPYDPWPGMCGSGKGKDTYTSGIEGQWTTDPFKWDNQFFQLLSTGDYFVHKGAGDKYQWENQDDSTLMMMTTDMSLVHDTNFTKIVNEFANNITALEEEFAAAFQQLTTDGAVWAKEKKCVTFNTRTKID